MGRRGGPPPPPPPPGACPASLPPPPFLSSSSFSLSAGAAWRRGSREEVGVLTTSGRTREGTCLCLPPLFLDVCVHTPPPPFGAAAAQVCGEEGDGDATDGGGQLLPAPSRCELLSFFFLPADSLLQNESCLWRHGEEEDGPHSAARRSKSVPPPLLPLHKPTDRPAPLPMPGDYVVFLMCLSAGKGCTYTYVLYCSKCAKEEGSMGENIRQERGGELLLPRKKVILACRWGGEAVWERGNGEEATG